MPNPCSMLGTPLFLIIWLKLSRSSETIEKMSKTKIVFARETTRNKSIENKIQNFLVLVFLWQSFATIKALFGFPFSWLATSLNVKTGKCRLKPNEVCDSKVIYFCPFEMTENANHAVAFANRTYLTSFDFFPCWNGDSKYSDISPKPLYWSETLSLINHSGLCA